MISTPVKPNVLQFLLQGYDTNTTNTLVTGFTKVFGSLPRLYHIHLSITLKITSQSGKSGNNATAELFFFLGGLLTPRFCV